MVVAIPAPQKEYPQVPPPPPERTARTVSRTSAAPLARHHSTSPVSPSASSRKYGTPLPHELLYSIPWTTQGWIKGIQPKLPNKQDVPLNFSALGRVNPSLQRSAGGVTTESLLYSQILCHEEVR